jgi:hypothetical protein
MTFAGEPRKLEAIYSQMAAGQELKAKQRDTPSGMGRSEGVPQRRSGRSFEEVGTVQSEFGGAVAQNPQYFYDEFMPKLFNLTSATALAEQGDFA